MLCLLVYPFVVVDVSPCVDPLLLLTLCLLVYPLVVVDVVSPCVSLSLFTFFIVP